MPEKMLTLACNSAENSRDTWLDTAASRRAKKMTHRWRHSTSFPNGYTARNINRIESIFMWRHCRHVGGQTQYIFSPLGNKIYFHAELFQPSSMAWNVIYVSWETKLTIIIILLARNSSLEREMQRIMGSGSYNKQATVRNLSVYGQFIFCSALWSIRNKEP